MRHLHLHLHLPLSLGLCLILSGGALRAEPPEWSGTPDQHIVIKTLPGQMRYDLADFRVEPGERVKLTLENPDDLQHNLLVVTPKSGDPEGLEFAKEVWFMGEAVMKTGFVPVGHERVLVASALLDPDQVEDLYFEAPDQPGTYPFVCTVPGHAMLMKGKMEVIAPIRLLEDLTYTVYEGEWEKVPDFAALEPVGQGTLPDGLVDIDVAGRKGKFGMVFRATLTVEKKGNYEFFLASDDGSRLVIDGEPVVEHDGIHPVGRTPQAGKVRLDKGTHTLELRYFDKAGTRGLVLEAKVPDYGMVPLSKMRMETKDREKEAKPDPILLAAEFPGEAVIYRSFILGSNPRGIAVGYPGGVNLCWDADVMGLAMIWRGAFMDASRHWTGRGQGSQPPAGYDVVATGYGYPLQVLESPDETWESQSVDSIPYERDKPPAEVTKLLSFHRAKPDYRFLGYALDAKRFPTFRFRFQDLEIEDRFDPARSEGGEQLVRTLRFEGAAKPETFFRIADGTVAPASDGWFAVSPALSLRVEGAEVRRRETAGGGAELLIPVTGAAEVIVTYAYQSQIGGSVE